MSSSKLKIAVCMFGHLRTYERCSIFLNKNLLSKYDCDIFMHTWSTVDHSTQTWHNNKPVMGMTDKNQINKKYKNIKNIRIEEQIQKNMGTLLINTNEKKELKTSIFGLSSMLESMRKSLHLCKEHSIEKNINYDFILMVRPDILIRKKLEIESIIMNQSTEEVDRSIYALMFTTGEITNKNFKNICGNDLLFFGKTHSIFEIIESNIEMLKKIEDGKSINHGPEIFFAKHIEAKGYDLCRIEKFKISQDWDILRSNKSLSVRKRFIQFRLRKNKILLWIFPTLLFRIFSLQVKFFQKFAIDIAIGNPLRNVNEN